MLFFAGEDGPSDDVEDVASAAKRRKEKLRIRTDFAEDKEAPPILTESEALAARERQDEIDALATLGELPDALDDGYYDEQEKKLLQKPRPRPALIPLAEGEEGQLASAAMVVDLIEPAEAAELQHAVTNSAVGAVSSVNNNQTSPVELASTDDAASAALAAQQAAAAQRSPSDEYRMIFRTATRSRSRVLNWKKGELLGYGAYGQVFMGLNADTGQLLAVRVLS